MNKKTAISLRPNAEQAFAESLRAIVEHRDAIQRLAKDLSRLESAIRDNGRNFNRPQGLKAVSTARALLGLCMKSGDQKHVPFCLAAIDYVVDCDDAISDESGIDGFDDDIEVLNAVIDHFDLWKQIKAVA